MASITFTIPDQIAPRVLDGFAIAEGYVAVLDNGTANPETKTQFMRRKIIEYVKNAVRSAEVQDAKNKAATMAGQSVDQDILIA